MRLAQQLLCRASSAARASARLPTPISNARQLLSTHRTSQSPRCGFLFTSTAAFSRRFTTSAKLSSNRSRPNLLEYTLEQNPNLFVDERTEEVRNFAASLIESLENSQLPDPTLFHQAALSASTKGDIELCLSIVEVGRKYNVTANEESTGNLIQAAIRCKALDIIHNALLDVRKYALVPARDDLYLLSATFMRMVEQKVNAGAVEDALKSAAMTKSMSLELPSGVYRFPLSALAFHFPIYSYAYLAQNGVDEAKAEFDSLIERVVNEKWALDDATLAFALSTLSISGKHQKAVSLLNSVTDARKFLLEFNTRIIQDLPKAGLWRNSKFAPGQTEVRSDAISFSSSPFNPLIRGLGAWSLASIGNVKDALNLLTQFLKNETERRTSIIESLHALKDVNGIDNVNELIKKCSGTSGGDIFKGIQV